MSDGWASEDARVWLEGEHAGMTLKPKMIEILVVGFDADEDDIWDEDDVQKLQEASSAKSAKALWLAILKDSAAKAGETIGESQKTRFEQWIEAQVKDEDGDEDPSSKKKKKYVPGEREAADIKAQGLSGPNQLRSLELCLFLGRVAGESELENGEYAAPPTQMVGGKLTLKGGPRRAAARLRFTR